MRCMACGAEMRVVQVVPDESMIVPGYQRHTLQCTGCNDVESRLVFSRQKTPVESVPAAPANDLAPAPVLTPTPVRVGERYSSPSVWARAFAMLRGRPVDKGS
jgi:hypothetical protein